MNECNQSRFYPNFRKETIQVSRADNPHGLHSFAFRIKGKRLDDLITLGSGSPDHPSPIVFHENPKNFDNDEGISDDDVDRWHELELQTINCISSCISADISGNGYYDLVLVGESLGSPQICWLENFGTNEEDWTCHNIGRLPGVNSLKLGHFTTTLSLQVLALVKSHKPDVKSSLVIFTRPTDVYLSRQWLVSAPSDILFTSVRDCVVVRGNAGSLDMLILSSQEGLSIAWYSKKIWHQSAMSFTYPRDYHRSGQLQAGRIKDDPVGFLVIAEVNKGSLLSVCTKVTRTEDLVATEWSWTILEQFANFGDASIEDMLCVDLDKDGIDEILVSVSGASAGIYYFVQENGDFVKYKLGSEAIIKFTAGHFSARNKLDFATMSLSHSPRDIVVHHQSFIPSLIRPFIKDFELFLYIPRFPSYICETDVINVAGNIFSLVLLPPDATYQIMSDSSEAVKVLQGSLGWLDSQSDLIERTCASRHPGCATSMVVDSPDGHVRSGGDGAVFIRMRPSKETNTCTLRALNTLPSFYPCDVRDHTFAWKQAAREPRLPKIKGGIEEDFLYLTAFHICFEAGILDGHREELMSMYFFAAAPGVSTIFSNRRISPASRLSSKQCNVTACIANPGGYGGFRYCEDDLGWSWQQPTRFEITRAKKVILPAMHECMPLWKNVSFNALGEVSGVTYPWHSWETGQLKQKRGSPWHVWVSFDFPTFVANQNVSSHRSCIVC